MQPCPYCERHFRNKQAVRAHMKHCPLKYSGNMTNMEKMFLRFLKLLPRMMQENGKVTKKDVMRYLKISEETLEDLKVWMRKTGYLEIIKFIKKAISMERSGRQV